MSQNKLNDLFDELTKMHYEEPLKAEPILGTPFFRNVFTLVYGVSKIGKSHSIAQVLVDAGLCKNDVVWLDKDYNVNESTLALFKKFTHLNKDVDDAFEKLLKLDGLGTIVVIDSLKDFMGPHDLDSNSGSQQVMEGLRRLIQAKYTVVCIAHATRTMSSEEKSGLKIKGNEETIKSKSDMIFKVDKNADYRKMVLESSRISGTSDIEKFMIYDFDELKNKIDLIINEHNENITVKELKNKLPSSMRGVFVENMDKLIENEYVGEKPHQKNMARKLL